MSHSGLCIYKSPMTMGCFGVGRGGPRGLDLRFIDGLVRRVRLARGWADDAPHRLFLLCFYNKTTPFIPPPTVRMRPKLTQIRGIPPPDSPNRYGCEQTP